MKTVAQAVEELVRVTVQLSDADIGREWKWRVYDDEGLRVAPLMTHHELRDLGVRLAVRTERPRPRRRSGSSHSTLSRGQRHLGARGGCRDLISRAAART
jgi:hypothetical protein